MSAPGGLRRKVPFWIWLPLLLVLGAGVVKLKDMQMMQTHRPIYEAEASREARFRWMDSVVRTSATARQRDLMSRVDSACGQNDRGQPSRDTVRIDDYRDTAKRVTDWAAEVRVLDSALELHSGLLLFEYDGPWTDAVRKMAVPLHHHPVRFSARISFAPDSGTCMLEFLVRDISLTPIPATPLWDETNAGH